MRSSRRAFLAGTGAVALGGCTRLNPFGDETIDVSGDWPRVEGDAAATGHRPGVGPFDRPEVRWTTEVGTDRGAPTVVVSDGVVYVSDGGTVEAYDATDGSNRWTVKYVDRDGSGYVERCLTVVDDRIYAGTHEGFAVLDSEGAELWSVQFDGLPGLYGKATSAVVADGSVYFVHPSDDTLFAYTTDGEERWTSDVDVHTGVAFADETVYAAGASGLHAFGSDGTHRWSVAGSATTTPTVADGTVYLRFLSLDESSGGAFAALDSDDGRLEWHVPIKGWRIGASGISDGRPYTIVQQSLYLFDRETEAVSWAYHTPDFGHGTFAPASNNVVYVAGNEGIGAYPSQSSSRRWELAPWVADERNPGVSNLAATDDALFVTRDGTLFAIA